MDSEGATCPSCSADMPADAGSSCPSCGADLTAGHKDDSMDDEDEE